MSSGISGSVILRYLLCLAILAQMLSCATVGRPSGGPKDNAAPKLITEKSSKSQVTNETRRKWFFTFDEFVKINNPNKNIIVSPPLTYPLKVKIKSKTVSVELDDREELKENTTYIFNFSDAIQDITEGNSARGMQHVFSTGPTIDSLSIGGQVIRAFSGDTVQNLSVLLYDNLSDSAVFLQKPYYLSFTDSNGIFNFNYLRSDTFQLIALEDDNANLIYDGPPEKIAFLSENLIIDSNLFIVSPLVLFLEEGTPAMEDYSFQSGLLTVNFEHQFYDTPAVELVGISVEDYNFVDQSIRIWYTGQPENNCLLILNDDLISDTIKMRYLKTKDLPRKEKVETEKSLFVDEEQNILLKTMTPIANINQDSIYILLDTTMINPFEVNMIDNYSLRVKVNNEATRKGGYLLLDNGALQAYDLESNDSIAIPYKSFVAKNTGNLFLEIQGLDSTLQYVVQLKSKQNNWERNWLINDSKMDRDSFYYLQPGILEITIIEDLDGNKRWSSGSFLSKTSPERVFVSDLKGLKANWDLETVVKTKF